MIVGILIAGIIIDAIWLLVTYISDEHRKVFLLIGGIASVILCIYTHEYMTLIISVVAGLILGAGGIGYRTHTLKDAKENVGGLSVFAMFVIFVANIFLVIALSCPGQSIFPWS